MPFDEQRMSAQAPRPRELARGGQASEPTRCFCCGRCEVLDRVFVRGGGAARCLASADAKRWLVFADDAYDFAVSLMAVAHSGGIAVLPPNAQEGTLNRLKRARRRTSG